VPGRRIPQQAVTSKRLPAIDAPKGAKIPPPRPPPERCWVFGFRWWRQVKNFGFDDVVNADKWFVSLMERLQHLGAESVDHVVDAMHAGGGIAGGLRCHPIDHDHEHVTMERAEFDWVAADYLDDEEHYPILQFQVSTALGRVIGFFDENWVFQILLLDPHHNLWLSKYADYKTRKTGLLNSEVMEIRAAVDLALEQLDGRPGEADRCRNAFAKVSTKGVAIDGETRIVCAIQDSDAEGLRDLFKKLKGTNLRKVVERGLFEYLQEADKILEEEAQRFADGSMEVRAPTLEELKAARAATPEEPQAFADGSTAGDTPTTDSPPDD
jgi:hypothetical protein